MDWYLVFVTVGLVGVYGFLLVFVPYFFTQTYGSLRHASWRSVALIVGLSCVGYAITFSLPGLELGNRFLHAYGGGCMGMLTCFLAWRDAKVTSTLFQFVILSSFFVVALGVASEIAEFLLQTMTGVELARKVNDTWLDLVSNVVGILVALVCLIPFYRK
jgi:hypothetical protein